MTMENIHIAKLKPACWMLLISSSPLKLRTVMRGDVHHDDRLFALFGCAAAG